MVKVAPVTISNKGIINLYTANAMSSIMYIAGRSGIPCREWLIYDQHPMSRARNMAVKELGDCTHLFFLDDDCVPPVDIMVRLLKHDKMVVSGWYNARSGSGPLVFHKEKHGWIQYKSEEWKRYNEGEQIDKLQVVDGVGAGCLMIKKEVFDIIDEPYFQETKDGVGEDLYFCDKCNEKNIPVYVDVSLYCKHWHWGLL